MKSRTQVIAALSAVLILASTTLSSCTPATTADTTTLSLADSYAPTHIFAESGVSIFMDEASDPDSGPIGGSEETLDFAYYPAGQMGTPRDLVSLNRSGVLDITPASAAYLSDQLPLSSVSDLPGMVEDSCVGAQALFDMMSPGGILYQEEYAPRGLRPLWVSVLPSYEILTVSRQINSPSDLRGLNIRTSGGALDATLSDLGAAAVSMPAPEAYEALSRKTVDGVAFPFISVLPYKLQEVLDYSTTGLNIGAFAIPYVISEETWSELDPAMRSRIERAGHDAQNSLCQAVNDETPAAIDAIGKDGVEFKTPDAQGMKEFEDKLAPVRKQWAENMDSIGKPGSQVLSQYEALIARYEGNSK
ncbi:MAG: TRAP transporter substrate-binding protein [Brevibacterium aurantiacum]|uniref:ABC transporter substrate-binding protein n=3 Tax=Brevibacterium aurantiacum TaxID=273384 RepID=A0A2A3ZBV1_BREAU|nr:MULTISPECIES: TRAP transporter substrate-binding protein DctP [unclassified Brevibacterium]AZL07360.1 ABC transporter substrate-binding protein [Brevibacterium aurantiacum]PCC48825.1 ABC transporter substrate-binding protein [Brevibacterium aurantiacum]SMX86917.1 TRAP-type C4-dicarboxylate transport system, substrate-binding protein [Brevibacterium sp. 239c]